MPVLYHHTISAASRFVRVCFHEVDFEAELVEELPWERRPDFLRINPAGTLPVCVTDNGHALCGPHIIAEWIDESFGVFKRGRRLLAEDPFNRAEIRRLTEWFMIKFEQDVVRPLVRERIIKLQLPTSQGGGAPDPKMLRTGRANIRQHMKYLSWLAGSRAWLAGDKLTAADITLSYSIFSAEAQGRIGADRPNIRRWLQQVRDLPSFQRATEKDGRETMVFSF